MAFEFTAEVLLKAKDIGQKSIVTVGNSLKTMGSLSLVAFGYIAAVVKISLDEYRKTETAMHRLNQSMINQGIYSKSLSQNYVEMAKALSSQGKFAQEDILLAESTLQLYSKQDHVSKELVKATMDFATAKSMDLNQAAEIVGKTIGTTTNALARHGILLDKTGLQSVRTAQAIKQIELHFGGQSEAALQGLGSIDKAKQAILHLLSVFGKILAPLIIELANYTMEVANNMQKNGILFDVLQNMTEEMIRVFIVFRGLTQTVFKTFGVVFRRSLNSTGHVLQGNMQGLLSEVENRLLAIKQISIEESQKTKQEIIRFDKNRKEIQSRREKEEHYRLVEQNRESQKELRQATLTQEQIFAARKASEIEAARSLYSLKKDDQVKKYAWLKTHGETETIRLDAELKQRQLMDEKLHEAEKRRESIMAKLHIEIADSIQDTATRVFDTMSQMMNSKYRAMVEVGKRAAMASIAVTGIRAVKDAYNWTKGVLFFLPPGVAHGVGMIIAGLIALWFAERLASIATVSPENPYGGGEGRGLNTAEIAWITLTGLAATGIDYLFQVFGYKRHWEDWNNSYNENDLIIDITTGNVNAVEKPTGANPPPNIVDGWGTGFGTSPHDSQGPGGGAGIPGMPGFADGAIVLDSTPFKLPSSFLGPTLGRNIFVRIVGGLNGSQTDAENLALQIYQAMEA